MTGQLRPVRAGGKHPACNAPAARGAPAILTVSSPSFGPAGTLALHSNVLILPALLAAARLYHCAAGARFLAAAITGYETGPRVGLAFPVRARDLLEVWAAWISLRPVLQPVRRVVVVSLSQDVGVGWLGSWSFG
jgi:hypothetical protein